MKRGKWFDTFAHNLKEILEWASARKFCVWRVHERGSGWWSLYAGEELPLKVLRGVEAGRLVVLMMEERRTGR